MDVKTYVICLRRNSGNRKMPKQCPDLKLKATVCTEVVQDAVTQGKDGSVLIKILAKPGAKRNRISGLSEEGVGVQISAPPADGEANKELVQYLTKLLGIRKSDVTLDKGTRSRNKIIVLGKDCGLSVETVLTKFQNEADA